MKVWEKTSLFFGKGALEAGSEVESHWRIYGTRVLAKGYVRSWSRLDRTEQRDLHHAGQYLVGTSEFSEEKYFSVHQHKILISHVGERRGSG